MNRIIKLLAALLLVTISLNAQHITEEQAFQKAQVFLQGKTFKPTQAKRRIRGTAQASTTRSFYVFNVEDNGGFVIVSGDERTKDILGYSSEGNIDLGNVPSNVRWLLEYYEQTIQSLDKTAAQAPVKGMRQTPQRENIAPFITTTWGQGAPYNVQCPTYGNENCLTGCVATAMAQVMNYLRCPEGQTGTIDGYTTNKLQIEVLGLEPTSFDWDNMTNDDIARLMRYCGQAVQMDYAPDESAAYEYEIPFAMMSSFGFDSTMGFAYPSGFGDGWEEFIYEELAAGRPVIYGARSDIGRHSFVCCGYNGGMFYINWGWNGTFDGYFNLSVLDVTENIAYNNDHCAIVHIQTSTGTPIEDGNGRVFTAQSPEGITLTFSVISESGKTCRVGFSDEPGSSSAIDESVTGTLTVPSEVEGYRVIHIGADAFHRNNLSRIILPETITGIYAYAFGYSFELTSITIPKNVSYIPNEGVFCECPKLREIIVDEDNPVYDSRENCNAVIHSSTNTLIAGCGGTTIPRSVTKIASNAFYDCYGMKNLFIHKDLVDIAYWPAPYNISRYPFLGCPDLESIVVEEGNPYYASPNDCNALIDKRQGELILGCSQTIIPTEAKFISEYAFFNNKKLKSINIPEGISYIMREAFDGCENLEEVTLSSSVDFIGENQFARCNLKHIYIPDGITKLNGTFTDNANLSVVTGGKNLIEIGNSTFSGCPIDSFTIGNKVETIGDAFERCYNLKSIVIPKNVTSIGRYAFYECHSLESMSVEEENTVYDSRDTCNAIIETATDKMVAGCKNTTFPNGLRSIADYCFWNCHDLRELNLPNSLEEIGNHTFYMCQGLQHVTLPNSLTHLGNGAFSDCTGLMSVTLSENLESIPSQAFAWCWNLTSVIIPESVTNINDNAFEYCGNLQSVTVEWAEPISLNSSSTFENCANCTLYVPVGCKAAYEAADYWQDFKEIKELIVGDVSGDGLISTDDVTALVEIVLGTSDNTFNPKMADMNGDGDITIADVTTLVNMIRGNQ